jgi:hypothetical protein
MYTQEEIQDRIKALRQGGVLWREIHKKFHPIPVGTLHKIMVTGSVPKKWWGLLEVRGSHEPRIAISKNDVNKAAATILNNLEPSFVNELARRLMFIEDGFGSRWTRWCPDCQHERQIMRPGSARCECR